MKSDTVVCDPFCGRGTTNFASRLMGQYSVGIDSSRVAAAISKAKLVNTTPERIVRCAKSILDHNPIPQDVPTGEFWRLAFHQHVLEIICRLREGLLKDCHSDTRIALRAIILGALHGPRLKTKDSYFSNQCQRTYAPKPAYAVKYWKRHALTPRSVDVLGIVEERAYRYYDADADTGRGKIILGDSRQPSTYESLDRRVDLVITSPPYYGMRTYVPDQWLRLWFVGGKPSVDYSMQGQIQHSSPELFAEDLRKVWLNLRTQASDDASLVIRFGGINDRKIQPIAVLESSLVGTGWRIDAVESAGRASEGRRQAAHIRGSIAEAIEELDVWARCQ